MLATRPAAVAGMFYPAAAASLREQVLHCLGGATHRPAETPAPPKLLIVPHAGYVYSGATAGRAYALLQPWAADISRVVMLGPAHRVALRGLAVPSVDCFETPLGRIAIDRDGRSALAGLPQVVEDDRAHADEHSLEVQLPFLQTLLGETFRLLPLAVGDANSSEVAEVIERVWGGDETLIVISSDLSHFLPYDQACATDSATVARIVELATDLDPHQACGARALNGALLVARRHGLQAQLLELCNSGDTAGDRDRVVGYASLVLNAPRSVEAENPTDHETLGAALVSRAGNSIATRLGLATEPEPPHPALARPGATFVTLHDARGELRGCIGRLEAIQTLEDDVRHNAAAAAFEDPRFEPLQAAEWPGLQIEISLLETAQDLPSAAPRSQTLRLLQPGVDGVIVEWRHHRSTFLPQVWQQLPEAEDFFSALLCKAGLPADFWADDLKLQRYRVRHFTRTDAARPA